MVATIQGASTWIAEKMTGQRIAAWQGGRSEEFDVVPHVVRLVTFVEQKEHLDHLANGAALLAAIADTGVVETIGHDGEKVGVVREKDTVLGASKGELRLVVDPEQTSEVGMRETHHVDSTFEPPNGAFHASLLHSIGSVACLGEPIVNS